MIKILVSFIILSLFFLPTTVNATVIIKQTDQYSNSLNVWQAIQELGDNLSGTLSSFTFRVSTARSNLNQFDYTVQNTRIYDRDAGSSIVARGCATGDPQNTLRGLIFTTINVPAGYEDVTIDFSCHNYTFIPGHRYLILITNANIGNEGSGQILFGAAAYANLPTDFFPQGGLRYANGNIYDYSNNSGSCDPVRFWLGWTNSGCNIWTSPRDDLYFILSDATPEPTPTPTPTPTPVPLKTPLILIPGIGGSELKVVEDTIWNKDDGHGGVFNHIYPAGEKVWVNEEEAANPGEDDYFDVLRMKTDGVTSEANIGVGSSLVMRAYGEAINFFTSDDSPNGYELNKDFFAFPYDWRLDNSENVNNLDNKIQDIKIQTGSEKVDMVAHSMGGLIARAYISDPAKAQNVRKLFTLGTPHLGTPDAIKKLRYGECLTPLPISLGPACLGIINSETRDVIQNMIGGYELAPSQGYYNLYAGQDNQHPFPFVDLRDIDSNSVTGALNYAQLKTLLTNLGHNTPLFTPSEAFHNLDSQLANTNGVEVTNIVGSGMATLGQIIEKYKIDFAGVKIPEKDEFKINGDDTVPLLSSSFGSSTVFYVKQKHGELPSNGPALNLVKNILSGNSQLPSGVSNQPYQFSGTGLSSHSPVNIHVYDSNGNHTGPTASGDFEANIPGSSYDTLDDAKFIFLPEDGRYTIKFEATGQGSFDFKIRKFESDENTKTVLYNDVPLTNSTKAEAMLDTNSTQPPVLQVDQDGNGTIDNQIHSSATLTGNANYDQTPPVTTIHLSGTQGNNGWFRSNVQVSLNTTDETNGSGVDKIEYIIDNGQTIQTYTAPFTVSQEGIFKLKVRSTDKAGNSETPKELEIKIDKTPPEALVQFNLTTQNLEINGSEITPGEVILQDEAGNKTKLTVEPKEKKRKEKLEIKTISYNDQSTIKLPDNKFEVNFKPDKKTGKIEDLDQTIKIKEEEKAKAKYDPKKNITRIEINENKEKKKIEEKSGIVLLQLLTNKGQLEIRY